MQAHEAAAYARSWHDSPVDDIFGGQLQSTVTCAECKRASHCFDPFLDLSAPLPRGTPGGSRARGVGVDECLAAFVESETLEGSEEVHCAGCKRSRPALKRLQVGGRVGGRRWGVGGWEALGGGRASRCPCDLSR